LVFTARSIISRVVVFPVPARAEIMRSIDPQIGQAGHLDGGET
jgi:hypothetical protein